MTSVLHLSDCSLSERRKGRKKSEQPEGDVVLDDCEEESDL